MKSFSALYKVRNVTPNTYCSFVKSYTSAATNCLQNPNELYPPSAKNLNEYGNKWSLTQTYGQCDQNPTRVYEHTYDSSASRIREYWSANNVNHDDRSFGTNMLNERSVCGDGVYSSRNQESSEMNYQKPSWNSLSDDKLDENKNKCPDKFQELDALCKDHKLKEAVEVLCCLEDFRISLDMRRYLLLMHECGEAHALEEAKQVHEHLTRSVWSSKLDVGVCNKILEMYGKCGSMEDAWKVFHKMSQRNLTSWDIMITWFAKNGHGEDAIDMFTEFKKIGFKPNDKLFFGVFMACSVLGDMKEGLLHFESMNKNYNIVPSMDHHSSVVDMLGRAGHLNEALEFIEKMPLDPSVEVWEIMMYQSRIHGDTQLGDRCAEIVQLLDPSRLDKQSNAGLIPIKDSDIPKEKGKKKLLGFNPLETKTKVHEYRAGDTSHPEHKKLYSQLRCLKQHMKEEGYIPQTKCVLHDIDQESKEEALLSHSERLALSEALMTSPSRASIRIIKNLRVCVDCHNALKIISKLVGRLIIARDNRRWHHFENGVCSCGDYW